MKNKAGKRVLSILLAVCFIVSVIPAAFADSDVTGHWAEEALTAFIDDGYLSGYSDGSYLPDNEITRAEFASLVNDVVGYTEESSAVSRFTDVSEDDWFYSDIAIALRAGYLKGNGDGTMTPNASITREQAFTVLARVLGLTADDEAVAALYDEYSDADEISDWAVDAVAAINAAGYISGNGDGTLSPADTLTRAEGVTLLYNGKEALQEIDPEDLPDEEVTYVDGVYTGTGAGYGGTLTVQVTIEGGVITSIEVTDHSETTAYYNMASAIIDEIIAANGTDGVDTVSGATYSSSAIITAVEACLSQAAGGEDTSTSGSTGSSSSGKSSNATKDTIEEDASDIPDGVYTGSAYGYSGTTTVQVTVENGVITDVTVLSHGDTTSYFNKAKSVIDDIIEANGTDGVDTVSGATYSSASIINAVANALASARASVDESVFVLMNVPYGDFYSVLGDDGVDSVSSATLNKTRTNSQTIAGGSYHVDPEGSDITGIIYYVYIPESALEDLNEITDESSVTITVTNRGTTTETTYEGSDALFEAESYSYYLLDEDETPSYYLVAEVGDSGLEFTEIVGDSETITGVSSELTTDTTYGDYKLDLDSETVLGFLGDGFVSAVTVNTSDGSVYGLRHVENIWKGYELAWSTGHTTTVHGSTVDYSNYEDMEGKTITSVTYYTTTGIYVLELDEEVYLPEYYTLTGIATSTEIELSGIPEDATIQSVEVTYTESKTTYTVESSYENGIVTITAEGGLSDDVTYTVTVVTEEYAAVSCEVVVGYSYVLMNIPYSDFYSVLGDDDVQAVSSATLNKTRTNNQTIAGGSYHVDPEGSDITGIIYPVYIPNDILDSLNEITDDDSVTISVTNRGTTSETTYEGADALFEAESYSYYLLSSSASYYLDASDSESTVIFSGIVGDSETISDVAYSFTTDTTYGDYQLDVDSDTISDILGDEGFVSAVTVNTTDGSVYGLRHVENIWKGYELAWSTGHTTTVHSCTVDYSNYEDMEGKTITSVTYYTTSGIYILELSEEIYVTPYYDGTVTAELSEDESYITLTGIPDDAENVTVELTYTESRTSYTVEAEYADGVITPASKLKSETTYTITISSDNYVFESLSVTTAESDDVYVLMNIPYSDFYSVLGDDDVQAVSSATCAKTMTGSLAGGSYHVNSDGTDITGIIYYVCISEEDLESLELNEVTDEDSVEITVTNRGTESTTVYEGSDALFQAESYSYYLLGEDEVPSYYLTAEVSDGAIVFTGIEGETTTISDVYYTFVTDTTYGDYQLNINSEVVGEFVYDAVEADEESGTEAQDAVYVSAVTINTSDGSVYGLRHVENIWLDYELAWSTGHTTTVHGCTVDYSNYEDMEGKTITSVTYYTTEGIYVLELYEEAYVVPYYNLTATATQTEITLIGVPEDAENVSASVSYSEGSGRTAEEHDVECEYADGVVTITAEEGLSEGIIYTVTVSADNYATTSCEVEPGYSYVLMNVPYSDFYSVLGDDGVQAVSSATCAKTMTGSLAGGSYHVSSDGTDITGIIYPVRIASEELESLGLNQVTDDDSVDITVTNRGTTSTTTYEGSDALFQAESYSYYLLSEAAEYYLTAAVSDGTVSFTSIVGDSETTTDVGYEFMTDTTYGDYQLNVDEDTVADVLGDLNVSAVTVNTSDGSVYGLRHVENIWLDYELAWSTGHTTTVHGCTVDYSNYEDMEGKTITSVTYYTTEGIYVLELSEGIYVTPYVSGVTAELSEDASYITISGIPEDADVTVELSYSEGSGKNTTTVYVSATYADGVLTPDDELTSNTTYTITITAEGYIFESLSVTTPEVYVYVLMNVPYGDFYSVLGDDDVQAVSSATLNKTRTNNQTIAGGSYHVDPEGSDITGIIYYVYIPESALEDLNEITDESSVTISVTNRGQASETTYEGSDALFEAESYSYYLLDEDETPSYYLVAEVGDSGPEFTEIVGDSETITGVSSELTTDTTYGDYQLDLDSETVLGFLGEGFVSAVTVNTSDGSVYGLRHVENIWKGYELAWSTGHTTTVHGSTVDYSNYEDMEGKTITSVTYYTTTGIYVLELDEAVYLTPYDTEEE